MAKWYCFYGSERLDSKGQRRRARAALRNFIEPEPIYRTGKMWND